MSHLSKPPLKSIITHPNQLTEQMQFSGSYTEGILLPDETLVIDLRIRKTIELLRANLHLTLSLAAIARIVNLSESRLRCLFSEVTGLSLAHFVKLLRLEAARRMLATEFLTVKEVMARTGIKDPSHFNRDFKTAFGVTPAQYRNLPKCSVNQAFQGAQNRKVCQDL